MPISLYNSPEVHINELLREAHPEGSANIIDTPSHEGVVEDSIEAQMKAIKMVYKQPVAKVIAALAANLESFGAHDLAEAIDKIAFEFYHQPVLIKVAAAGATPKVIAATDLLIKILQDYTHGSGREFIIAINKSKGQFISQDTWEDAYNTVKDFLISTIKDAIAELEDMKKHFIETTHQQEMLTDGVVQMHFNRQATELLEDVFADSRGVAELSKYGLFDSYIKTMSEMLQSLNYVVQSPFTAAQQFGGATEHDKVAPPTAVPNATPTDIMQRLETIKIKIGALQQQADGLIAVGVAEGEVDAVLTQYLPAIASFKKIYAYVSSTKGQVPESLNAKVLAAISVTEKQLAALEAALGKLGG